MDRIYTPGNCVTKTVACASRREIATSPNVACDSGGFPSHLAYTASNCSLLVNTYLLARCWCQESPGRRSAATNRARSEIPLPTASADTAHWGIQQAGGAWMASPLRTLRQAQVAFDAMAIQARFPGNLLARHPRGGQRINRLIAIAAADDFLLQLKGETCVGLRWHCRYRVHQRAGGGLLFHYLGITPYHALDQFPQVLHQWSRSAICTAWGASARAPRVYSPPRSRLLICAQGWLVRLVSHCATA